MGAVVDRTDVIRQLIGDHGGHRECRAEMGGLLPSLCAGGGTVFAGGVNGAGEIAGQRARTASLGGAHERAESAGGRGSGEGSRVCRMKPRFILSIHPNMI